MTRGTQPTSANSTGLEEIGHPGPGRYTELPVHGLADVFRCAWVRHVAGGVPAPPIRIVPDTCADFIATDDGRTWLVGPATRVELSALPPGTVARGLRIQPQALGVVIDADPAELTDRHARFDEVLPAHVARTLADALLTGGFDGRLLRQLWPEVVLEERITRGIRMLASEPELSVEVVARACAMSPRQFRRAVRQASGLAPKTLQRVSRMHRVLDIARMQPRASLAELSAAAGFADQSHLARDVRQLADLTPQQLLRQYR
jgi:AraC-like DNA-binding protein